MGGTCGTLNPKSKVLRLLGFIIRDSRSRLAFAERHAGKTIADNTKQVKGFRVGKEKTIGWFVGRVVRENRGTANPKMVYEL